MESDEVSPWSWRRASGSAALALALCGLVACTGEPESEPEPTPSTTSATPSPTSATTLSFAVFGNPSEIAAYQSIINTYNRAAESVQVELRSYPDAGRLADDLIGGG